MSCSHFRHPRPSLSKGFTLIELLVVVSIIALLVSILVPAVQEAKEAAMSVVCQSSLHQIGIATSIYTDDNHGTFFWQRGNQTHRTGPYRPWFHSEGILSSYLQGDPEAVAKYGCPTHENDESYWGDGDYTANRYIVALPSSSSTPPPFGWPSTLLKIRNPSRKIVILETVTYGPYYSHAPDGFDYTFGLKIGDHHQGNNNILWADMHVETMLKIDLEWNTPNLLDPYIWLYPEVN